jgi:hypothetical protein
MALEPTRSRELETMIKCTMFIETCIAAVILFAVAMGGLAQEKPDFSGEWILNRQASTLSPGADAVQSGVWRIEHREPTFRHKASLVTASNPVQYEYELRSDGREASALSREPRLCRASGGKETLWSSCGESSILTVRGRSLFGTNCSMRDDAFERLNRFAAPITIRTTFGFSSGVEQTVHDRPTKSPESPNHRGLTAAARTAWWLGMTMSGRRG